MLQIFAIIDDTSVINFRKNLQHKFPKMRGGGQRPFGTFPKIHPFWKGSASLSPMCTVDDMRSSEIAVFYARYLLSIFQHKSG